MRRATVLAMIIVLVCLSGCVATGDVYCLDCEESETCDCLDCDCVVVEETEPELLDVLDDGSDGIGEPEMELEPLCCLYVVVREDVSYTVFAWSTECPSEGQEVSAWICEMEWVEPEPEHQPEVYCRPDQDGDGYGSHPVLLFLEECPAGFVVFNQNNVDEEDCDDNDPAVHPGAIELCDHLDNDCDNEVDEDYREYLGQECVIFSSDGYCAEFGVITCNAPGDIFQLACSSSQPGTIWSIPSMESCYNSLDDDCDGRVNESCPCVTDNNCYPSSCISNNVDDHRCTEDCATDADCPVNWECSVSWGGICWPMELCDGVDNDHDGQVDEGCLNIAP